MSRMADFLGMLGGNQNGSGFGSGGMNLPGPLAKFGNIVGKFQQFMQNPMSAFMGSGINFPSNVNGNPDAMINYMRSSGIMSDDQYNQCSNMANLAQRFFGGGQH